MLRITIDLIPKGVYERQRRRLAVAYIWNDLSGDGRRGNYQFRLFARGRVRRCVAEGAIRDFPRKRLGGWDLLFRALREVVGKRNP